MAVECMFSYTFAWHRQPETWSVGLLAVPMVKSRRRVGWSQIGPEHRFGGVVSRAESSIVGLHRKTQKMDTVLLSKHLNRLFTLQLLEQYAQRRMDIIADSRRLTNQRKRQDWMGGKISCIYHSIVFNSL